VAIPYFNAESASRLHSEANIALGWMIRAAARGWSIDWKARSNSQDCVRSKPEQRFERLACLLDLVLLRACR
jgi:hypothetical protein